MINLSSATPAPATAAGRRAQANALQQNAGLPGAPQADANSFHDALVPMLGKGLGNSFSAAGDAAVVNSNAAGSRKTDAEVVPALDASALPNGLALPLPSVLASALVPAEGLALDASALPLPQALASALIPAAARQTGLSAVVAGSTAALGQQIGADTALALDASTLPAGLAVPHLVAKTAPTNVLAAVHSEPLKDVLATPLFDTAGSRSEPLVAFSMGTKASDIGASTSTHAVPEPSAAVQTRVGERGWDQAVGDKLVWMVNQKHQVAQLHLNPPDLGPLKIAISLDQNQASAQFFSAHAAVREALEAAMPRLREMLADSGITLGNASVGAEAFREPAQQQPRAYVAQSSTVAADSGTVSSGERRLRPMLGLVDTFA